MHCKTKHCTSYRTTRRRPGISSNRHGAWEQRRRPRAPKTKHARREGGCTSPAPTPTKETARKADTRGYRTRKDGEEITCSSSLRFSRRLAAVLERRPRRPGGKSKLVSSTDDRWSWRLASSVFLLGLTRTQQRRHEYALAEGKRMPKTQGPTTRRYRLGRAARKATFHGPFKCKR